MSHVMIDLETLGFRPDAAILQIAAVVFNPETNNPETKTVGVPNAFNCYVSPGTYHQPGRAIDQGTLLWWMSNPGGALPHLRRGLANAIPLGAALLKLTNWFHARSSFEKIERVWCRGLDFDVAILRHAYGQFGDRVPPWKYNEGRDTRTIDEILGQIDPSDMESVRYRAARDLRINVEELVEHDALHDCVVQAHTVMFQSMTTPQTSLFST